MFRRFINLARRSPLRLFDVYLAVDWSARSKPSAVRPTHDALWIGETLAGGLHDTTVTPETYWRTRHACVAHLRSRLVHHSALRRRVLVGFDFAFGYPAGFAQVLGLSGDAPWRLIWNELARRIVDDEQNCNNRFAVAAQFNARCGGDTPGPFWGGTAGQAQPSLEMTSPRGGYPYPARYGLSLERLRCTDKVERGVQSVWKLSGSGSVGGQTLVGIPAVLRLRNHPQLSSFGRVWPFETDFTPEPSPQGPAIVYAEIWPGLLATQLDLTMHVRDQAQVRAVVQWLARLDAAGTLGTLFESPPGLGDATRKACIHEEGWILGVGHAKLT